MPKDRFLRGGPAIGGAILLKAGLSVTFLDVGGVELRRASDSALRLNVVQEAVDGGRRGVPENLAVPCRSLAAADLAHAAQPPRTCIEHDMALLNCLVTADPAVPGNGVVTKKSAYMPVKTIDLRAPTCRSDHAWIRRLIFADAVGDEAGQVGARSRRRRTEEQTGLRASAGARADPRAPGASWVHT